MKIIDKFDRWIEYPEIFIKGYLVGVYVGAVAGFLAVMRLLTL